MTFLIKNLECENAVMDFKPFQLKCVVTSVGGSSNGYCKPFNALIDTGARHTCISRKRMATILPEIRDEKGNILQPFAHVRSQGVYGKIHETPVYVLPNFYMDKIHLTNVIVIVPDTANFDCLIGRSILHQCVSTFDPEDDTMCFEFRDSLKKSKQTLQGLPVFDEVKLFAEF
ncbi:MAG: retropepsin-like domain-containing protein [Oscillospiraceae bacterium]|nr:retropepsin-like domain-containing protein [Oscillospiraceae bacterium]